MTEDMERPIEGQWYIEGEGGGKGGGSGSSAPDSPGSKGIANILDLISEGTIQGLVNGGKSIFLNDTPVLNNDGTTNFAGLSWAILYGLPTQTYIPGFNAATTPDASFSSTEVKHSTGALVHQISDNTVDAVVVTIHVPTLATYDSKGVQGATVDLTVECQAVGSSGAYVQATPARISGKYSSGYDLDIRVNVAQFGTGPWNIRVTKVTADSTNLTKLVNNVYVSGFQLIYDHKFSYPYSAVMGLSVDAQFFGTSIPQRAYELYGLIISVPTNYNPTTRNYTGLWDGTFKQAWTNNPAWILYDLLTNTRYGLGLAGSYVDKWGLYTIAQYCDGVDGSGNYTGVPNGFGGYEPRFTYNGVIRDAADAYKVLSEIASTFRGMLYWSAGQVMASQSALKNPVKMFTPANVIDGSFEYTGSSILSRHTSYAVAWQNPANGYKLDYEIVEDPTSIYRLGMKQAQVTAVGCTSRGQARRFGRWALALESACLDTVRFQCGFDGADLVPGNIISIADPSYAGVRMGGRLKSINSTTSVTLDAPFTFVAGHTYTLSVMTASGAYQTVNISNGAGTTANVTTATALTSTDLPIAGAIFIITDVGNVVPRQFQVLSVTEQENGAVFEVNALQYDTSIFSIADNSASFDTNVTNQFQSLPKPNFCAPASGVTVTYSVQPKQYGTAPQLYINWNASTDTLVSYYQVSYRRGSDNWVNLPPTASLSADINDPQPGLYTVQVVAYNTFGIPSAPAVGSLDISASGATGLNLISSLQTQLGGSTFNGPDVTMSWLAAPISDPLRTPGNGVDAYFKNFRVQIMQGATVLRTEYVTTPSYVYDITKNQADGAGRSFTVSVSTQGTDGSFSNAATLNVSNPYPSPTGVTITADFNTVYFAYNVPLDPDYVGVKVYMSTTSGFTPGAGNLVYNGNGQAAIIAAPSTTYYLVYQFYDLFGTTGCPLSAQQTITTAANITPSIAAPNTPTGLALATAIAYEVDGTPYATVTATWNTQSDAATFSVGVAQNGGGTVYNSATTNAFKFRAVPGQSQVVSVAAISRYGTTGGYTSTVSINAATDATVPAAPSGVTGTAAFQNIFLSWTNPTGTYVQQAQVWENTTNNSATATLIATVNATPSGVGQYVRSGLATGQTRYYWVKAVTSSGVVSAFSTVATVTTASLATGDFPTALQPVSITATLPSPTGYTGPTVVFNQADGKVYRYTGGAFVPNVATTDLTGTITGTQIGANTITSGNIAANTITAGQIAANTITAGQIAAATITSTQIAAGTITAANILAGTITSDRIAAGTLTGDRINTATSLPGTITVGATGVSIATVQSQAAAPAATINAGSTTINPGNILISGATTLANWRNGTDATKIEGGNIYTNSITSNSLKIGSRAVNGVGINFTPNSAGGYLAWSAGYITYIDDTGAASAVAITAGNTAGNTPYVYVYWTKGAGSFNVTTSYGTAMGGDNVLIASYFGGASYAANYGGTIIDGTNIVTGTITATQIAAGTITASQIAANSITADRLTVTNLSAISANLGSITGGALNINGAFIVDASGNVTIQNATSGARLQISNSVLQVFDASNVLRVRLGLW